jgi:SAM-dependent methyltransferase
MTNITFELAEIPEIDGIIFGTGSPEAAVVQKQRRLVLPSWVDTKLNPFSTEYRDQQSELWKLISGNSAPYDPHVNEQTLAPIEGVKRPGVYVTGNSSLVGDHIVAYGHILQRSGINSGDHVLEYGPGFGQLALAFARLGAIVDTVEVDPTFHRIVGSLAAMYDVSLRCHRELFGYVPPDRPKFDLVLFYESFHHCWEFQEIVPKLRSILSSKGRVLMAGEPIVTDNPYLPYPWGVRLDAETVCVIRRRGWMELGFQESFLASLFTNNGFSWRKHATALSHFATVYEAEPV